MKDELIVFKHIGKTGGTSLRYSIMAELEPKEVLLCYGKALAHDERCLMHEECERAKNSNSEKDWADYIRLIVNLLNDDRGIRVVYGHFVAPHYSMRGSIDVSSWNEISSRETRFFAMMRHPYTHIISLYGRYLRQFPNERMDFKEWIATPKLDGGGHSMRASYLANSQEQKWLRHKTSEYDKFEKILFFEEYAEGLAVMSDVLGVELKEQRKNIHPNSLERSAETDRLIDENCSNMLRLYDHFWSKR
jgi:hypothetical protein